MLIKIYKQYFKINFIDTFPNTNKYFIKFIDYFNNYNSLPKLHRWCNTTSPIMLIVIIVIQILIK